MHPSPQDAAVRDDATNGPATSLLAVGLLLAGLGTVLLGPILPAIALRWHLTDQQTGPLFFAKFVGSFLGGVTVPRRLRNGVLLGTLLAAGGFAAFGFANGLLIGCMTLFVAGFGLGQIIASTNILAGHRYTRLTGSALSTLNFFFSLGAVITGILVAGLEPRLGLGRLLLLIAAVFAATGVAGRARPFQIQSKLSANKADANAITLESTDPAAIHSSRNDSRSSVRTSALVIFAAFLFLYGGLETCLAGWLTTFTFRYSDAHLLGGQTALVLLLVALTAGRALASIALRFVSEQAMQRASLIATVVLIPLLALSTHATSLGLWSILLGLALAPFFPATFALLMYREPNAREAGLILAVSGLGAAVFPWLMGAVSTHTGSLRVAMAVPAALALLLLAVSLIPQGITPRVARD